jgi:hypothetical protein
MLLGLTLLLGLIALLLLASTLVTLARAVRAHVRWVRVVGRVVAHEPEPEGNGVSAVVAYANGLRVVATTSEDPAKVPLGMEMIVRHAPDDPRRARLERGLFAPPLALAIALAVIGPCFAALCFALLSG